VAVYVLVNVQSTCNACFEAGIGVIMHFAESSLAQVEHLFIDSAYYTCVRDECTSVVEA
jgi:hypothetical protein